MEWYEAANPGAAARFVEAVDEAVRTWLDHPGMFPRVDEWHRHLLVRHFLYGLIYKIEGEFIDVVALAHVRRRAGSWRGRS